MENQNFVNPFQVIQSDPENAKYLLIAEIVMEDEDNKKIWKEFENRAELYKYIKENLETESDIIDISRSYVIMDNEAYSFVNKTSVKAWMIVVSDIYGDSFNPSHFEIKE